MYKDILNVASASFVTMCAKYNNNALNAKRIFESLQNVSKVVGSKPLSYFSPDALYVVRLGQISNRE